MFHAFYDQGFKSNWSNWASHEERLDHLYQLPKPGGVERGIGAGQEGTLTCCP